MGTGWARVGLACVAEWHIPRISTGRMESPRHTSAIVCGLLVPLVWSGGSEGRAWKQHHTTCIYAKHVQAGALMQMTAQHTARHVHNTAQQQAPTSKGIHK